MASQMRRGFPGTPKAGKAGSQVRQWAPSLTRFFRPRSGSGIAAHGMPKSINRTETNDRREG